MQKNIFLWPVWIKGGMRESRIELVENRLIFNQFSSTPPPLPFPQIKRSLVLIYSIVNLQSENLSLFFLSFVYQFLIARKTPSWTFFATVLPHVELQFQAYS